MKEVMRNESYCPGIKCDQHEKEEKRNTRILTLLIPRTATNFLIYKTMHYT